MIRVVTYNIRSGLGTDGIRSIRRIANVLVDLKPDVVCLQEVDQHVPRSWLANQPKFLGMRLGMQAVFQRNISFGVGGYGNCVLVKPRADHCRCHRLPGGGEPRGLLEVQTTVDGNDLLVFCTHLSTAREARELQAAETQKIASRSLGPKILCGDLNDTAGSDTLKSIMADPVLVDSAMSMKNQAPTHGTREAGRRIDFVLVDRRFGIKSYDIVATNASDHQPVVVDIEMT